VGADECRGEAWEGHSHVDPDSRYQLWFLRGELL
jgi:hypothetical protein